MTIDISNIPCPFGAIIFLYELPKIIISQSISSDSSAQSTLPSQTLLRLMLTRKVAGF